VAAFTYAKPPKPPLAAIVVDESKVAVVWPPLPPLGVPVVPPAPEAPIVIVYVTPGVTGTVKF
jgi:hypothetical protein